MLQVASLTKEFIDANAGLKEVIDDKGRPHGIVTIEINNLDFAIPLRSNMNHKYGVILDTVTRDGKRINRGLDFTKAMLIRDRKTDIGKPFFVPDSQKKS